jgi:hypothetical protein
MSMAQTLKGRGDKVAFLEGRGYKRDTRTHDNRVYVMSRSMGSAGTYWIDAQLKQRALIDFADRLIALDNIVW